MKKKKKNKIDISRRYSENRRETSLLVQQHAFRAFKICHRLILTVTHSVARIVLRAVFTLREQKALHEWNTRCRGLSSYLRRLIRMASNRETTICLIEGKISL